MEEAKARRERLAKMRSLLFYHELKAKRLKAIKSKEFHKKQAKVRGRWGIVGIACDHTHEEGGRVCVRDGS